MKSLLTLALIFHSLLSMSQTEIKFQFKNNKLSTQDSLTNLVLPIKLFFPPSLAGNSVSFVSETNQILAMGGQKFGEGDLEKVDETDHFVVFIADDKSVSPGDDKLNATSFLLQVGRHFFKMSIKADEKVEPLQRDEPDYVPGYVYYDVFTLLDPRTSTGLMNKILATYGIDDVSKNEFLADVFPDKTRVQAGVAASLLGSLGSTDITYFAEGLARFLAERTKEELNEAFFNKMRKQLNTYPELKTVFPKTTEFLNVIDSYAYASVIQVLKEAFETDVQNLPDNLYNIKSLSDSDCDKLAICGEDKDKCEGHDACQKRMKALAGYFATQDGRWLALGMFTVKEAFQSTNPSDLLNSVATAAEFDRLRDNSISEKKFDDLNIVSGIELGNLLSQSLVSKEEGQVWVTTAQLDKLFRTKNAFKVYLGLLLSFELRKENKIVIQFAKADNKPITFGGFLRSMHGSYEEIRPLISNTHKSFNAASNAARKIIEAADKSATADPQALYNYYKTLTSSLTLVIHDKLLNQVVGRDLGAAYAKVQSFLNPSVDLVYHVATKKYSAAVYDASILLSGLSKNDSQFKPIAKSFTKYGTLVSTVASAQSSEEVKTALEASVLPVGSYSIKRKTDWSISINAHVGAYFRTNNTEEHIPSVGLSAPVGLNISKGFSKSGNQGGLSLNLQLIDIGALVNHYLLKGDTSTVPNDFSVKLSNVFAPGFNLAYNVPKMPVAIAFGGQYVPTLYKLEQVGLTQQELKPTDEFRWQFMVLIDIPMINLKVWDFDR
jgi:hypothetical protein